MATVQDKIAGLYAAFFNRAPDKTGFDTWVDALSDGTSTLEDIAAGFAGHPVFTSTYSSMTNTEFVNAIYTNMLGTTADAGGLAYYVAKLDDTTLDYSQADMVAEFIGGVLDADLTDSAFDSLTAEERAAAEERQSLMQNKVAVSQAFIEQLGDTTDVVDALNPEADPAYVASINILSGVTSDSASVTTATNLITTLATNPAIAIATINEIVDTNGSITDDTTVISDAQVAVNEAPVFATIDSVEEAENVTLAAGTVVATAAATDAEDDTLTYSLSGDARFEIDAETGAISVIADTTFDYETETSVTLTVTATDGIESSTTDVVINVTDEPASYDFTADAATAVDGSTVEFTFTATEDLGATTEVAYTITGVDAVDVVGGAGSLTGTAAVVDGEATVTITLLPGANAGKTVTASIDGMSLTAQTDIEAPVPVEEIISSIEIADADGAFITREAGDTGTVNYDVRSSEYAGLDAKFIVNGNANINVVSGSGDDTIFVDSEGNNTVEAGSGNDTVVLGAGNNLVIIGDGELGTGTVVGGTGVNTVKISGTNTVETADFTNISHLIIEDGAVLTISEDLLASFDTIQVLGTTAVINVTDALGADETVENTVFDLTSNLTGTIAELNLADNVDIALSAEQISNIVAINGDADDALGATVATDIEGYIAAQAIAVDDNDVTITLGDSIENILANADALAGVTVELSAQLTVAEAMQLVGSGVNVAVTLVDTAANLALAPVAVYDIASSVEASDTATAAQATAIQASLNSAGGFAAGTVTLNVADDASMLASFYTDTIDADTVVATTAATTDEAVVIYAANTAAEYSIEATAAEDKANDAMDNAVSITATDALSVAQLTGFNTDSDVDISAGYDLTDSYANITGAAASVTTDAANIIVNDANITVAKAYAIEALRNTGTNSYVIEDLIATLLSANSSVVNSATAVSTSTAPITAAQMNSLVNKWGTTKLSDANIDVTDTFANLATLTANSLAELNTITVSNEGTVTEILALEAMTYATGVTVLDKIDIDGNYAVSDSAAALAAAVEDADTLALLDAAATVTVTGNATVEQIADINAALAGSVETGYDLVDDIDTLAANDAIVAAAGSATAGTITVTGTATFDQISTLDGVFDGGAATSDLGVNVTYSISDTAATVISQIATEVITDATSVSITDASITAAEAETLADATTGLANFDGVYTISDNVAALFDNTDTDDDVLNGAVSVTLVDSVASLTGGNGPATMAQDTIDAITVSDALATIDGTSDDFKASVTTMVITDVDLNVDDDAATVNALTADYTVIYGIADSYANMVPDTAVEATTTFVANATTITPSDVNLSVDQLNTLAGLTSATITQDISDTIANLTAASGVTAMGIAGTVTISDILTATATVAQANTLIEAGVTVTNLLIADTAASLTAADANGDLADIVTAIGAGGSITVSDNGATTLTVAGADNIYDAISADTDGSSYGNYNIVDSAVNIAAANTGLLNFASSITANDAASVVEATAFVVTKTSMGTVSYTLSDDATTLATDDANTAAVRNGATDIIATDAADVDEAVILNGATNSGTTSYDISDTSAAIVAAITHADAATQAANIAAIDAAGEVTASDAATAAQASEIAALDKAVVYSISDNDAAALAASTGLDEAVNITLTVDTATATEAQTVLSASNSGTTTLFAVTDTGAAVAALNLGSNDVITTLTVSDEIDAATATSIAAKDTGANIGTLNIADIADTTAALIEAGTDVLDLVTGAVTATDAMSLAEKATLGGSVDVYSLEDSFTNLMQDDDVIGTVNNNAVINAAATVTVTDTALTIAQATELVAIGGATYVYDIVDNDAAIVAEMAGGSAVLAGATTVTGFDGVALTLETINGTFSIVGTKADLDTLSDVLQTAELCYEVTVADLEADPDTFSSLALNQSFRTTDTVANLTAGNALIPSSAELVVTDEATLAEATAIKALNPAVGVVYDLSDEAANLVAGAVINGAVNVTATTDATFAEAEVLADATNSGSVTYSINDVDTNFAADDNLDNAVNITVTGTTGLSTANAQTIINARNTGSTIIALVSGSAEEVAAMTIGTNDTITAITVKTAATVVQAVAAAALSADVTYDLSDTAEALADADSAILNGAGAITATDDATVAQATIIDAATAADADTTFGIADTAAAILAADVALLAKDSNGVIVVTDASISAEVATQLAALDAANDDFTITHTGVADYAITDTAANLLDAANATVVGDATVVEVTDVLTTANAALVQTAAASDADPVFDLADTYGNLAFNQIAITDNADDVTITNQVNVAQAVLANGWSNSGSLTFSVTDTAAKVATDIAQGTATAVVDNATVVTLSTAATVADAGYLVEMTNLAAGYAIEDTATNVQAAIDTANAVGAADRDAVLGATSITLTTAATVAEAIGDLTTEARGLYTIDGISYDITDSGTAIVAGLSGIDAAGITAAGEVALTDGTGLTVVEATTLLAQANFVGWDHDSDSATAGVYNIEDLASLIAVADVSLIESANAVTANGTAEDDVINLSMFTTGISINGLAGADTITGTDGGDTIDVGAAGDSDTVVLTVGSGDTSAAIDEIINFTTAEDTIKTGVAGTVANYTEVDMSNTSATDYEDALSAANTALDGTVLFAVVENSSDTGDGAGTAWDGTTDSYLFIDWDVDGTADQAILLTGVLGANIDFSDIIA